MRTQQKCVHSEPKPPRKFTMRQLRFESDLFHCVLSTLSRRLRSIAST
jgi:hypothetical protein